MAEAAPIEALDTFLQGIGVTEPAEDTVRREHVLSDLTLLLQGWARGLTPEAAEDEAVVKVYTFGSYRLGLRVKGSDIDTLVVGPRHISRDDFFRTLPGVLTENGAISRLSVVADSYVPVIKFEFNGIDVDLLYAGLTLESVPAELDIQADSILKDLDEQTSRSLNGVRVTEMILQLVPDVDSFRDTLQLIKYWASRRGIYSNVFGFCGGVAWAMLTARICQLFPTLSAIQLVQRFFDLYLLWRWPTPVILAPIVLNSEELGLRVWEDVAGDRDLFPVITPTYPAMNSTYNVSLPTFNMLKSEFRRGQRILTTAKECSKDILNELCATTDIFLEHTVFITVTVGALNDEQLEIWLGWVRSKMRVFVQWLAETGEVEPFCYPHAFTPESEVDTPPATDDTEGSETCQPVRVFYIGLNLVGPKRPVNLRETIKAFLELIQMDSGVYASGMTVVVDFVQARDLPNQVFFDDRRPAQPAKLRKRKNKTKRRRSASSTDLDSENMPFGSAIAKKLRDSVSGSSEESFHGN